MAYNNPIDMDLRKALKDIERYGRLFYYNYYRDRPGTGMQILAAADYDVFLPIKCGNATVLQWAGAMERDNRVYVVDSAELLVQRQWGVDTPDGLPSPGIHIRYRPSRDCLWPEVYAVVPWGTRISAAQYSDEWVVIRSRNSRPYPEVSAKGAMMWWSRNSQSLREEYARLHEDSVSRETETSSGRLAIEDIKYQDPEPTQNGTPGASASASDLRARQGRSVDSRPLSSPSYYNQSFEAGADDAASTGNGPMPGQDRDYGYSESLPVNRFPREPPKE